MTWDITNNNYDDLHIKVTNGWATYYLPKFRIYMVVEEPYLTIYWTDSEKGQMNDTRSLVLDYNDVSSTPASATALKADIEAMELSGIWTSDERIEYIQGMSSSLIEGGEITQNANPALFDIAAGYGIIVDAYTTPSSPVVYRVSWVAQTGVTVTNLGSTTKTHLYIDNTGALVQQTAEPTSETRRDYLYLARIGHPNMTTILTIINNPDIYLTPVQQLRDLEEAIGIINEGVYVEPNGANLNINSTAGRIFLNGINFQTSNKNPSFKSFVADSAITFGYFTQTGPVGPDTAIDPGSYDVAGTVTAIGPVRTTNQRIFLNATGGIIVQYGQVLYNSFDEARLAVLSNSETFVLNPNVDNSSILIGILTVESNATSLINVNKAVFVKASKFGEVTGGGAAASGSGVNFSAGTTSANLASVVFSNSNGVSFGLNGSTITASHNGLTSQTVQPAVGLNTAQTNVTWTVNSSGISIDAGAYLTTARASNDAVGLNTAGTNITWTVNSSGISINAGAYLTTARASNDAIGLNTAGTNITWTVNSSGISINAGAYLTTARASTDAVGLNTAQTNVTWTVNSSGISLNAAGYAGTGTSATNASVTLNSNGLAISVAAPGGGVAMSRFPFLPVLTNALSINSATMGATGGSTQVTGIGYLNYMPIPNEIQFRDLMIEHSNPATAGTGSVTIGNMMGIYTLEANTRLSLISSFQNVIFVSQNSSSAFTGQMHWGTASSTNSTNVQGNVQGQFTGFRWAFLNQSERTLAAGNYYIGFMHSASTAGSYIYNQSIAAVITTGHTMLQVGNNQITYDFNGRWNGAFSTTTNMSSIGLPCLPSTIHTSAISGTNNASQQRGIFFVMNRASTT